MDFGKVLALIDAMNREEVDAAIVGSTAMAVHGFPRATTDIDFLVRADVENIEKLKRALRAVWSDPEIDLINATEFTGEYPWMFYGPPGETFSIDLIARAGEYTYDTVGKEDVIVEGRTFRVVTLQTLYKMKRAAGRYLDRWDSATIDEKIEDEGLNAGLEVQNS